MEYELSEYQKKIKTYFITHPHNNMAIEALAGCAKSFTALMLTNLTKTSDVYIAFNKSIQMEMKEKLTNPKTKCYTMHGLALSVMSYNLSKVKKEYKLDNFKTLKNVDKLFEKYYKGTKKYSTDMKMYLEENYSVLYNLIRLKNLAIDMDNVEYLVNENAIFQDAENCIPPLTSEITDWLQELDIIDKNDFEENCICDFTDMLYITKEKLSTGEWEVPYWLLFTNITIDECLPYDTWVKTSIGNKRIGVLYKDYLNKKELPLVKSFNHITGEYEYKEILNVKKHKSRDIYEIKTEGLNRIKATDNHRFLTQRGYVQVKDLKIGKDYLCLDDINAQKTKYLLNEDQLQIILGSFLGDGSLSKQSKFNTYRIRFTQGQKQLGYLKWKAKTLNCENIRNIKSGYTLRDDIYTTSSKVFILDDDLWNLMSQIDLRGLAVWFQDDGTTYYNDYVKSGKNVSSIYIAANNLSEDQIDFMRKLLKNKYGIDTRKKISHEKYFDIVMNTENSRKFLKLISPYMHPDCYYKNEMNIPNEVYRWDNKFKSYGGNFITEINYIGQDDVYDIEVKDNHNFVCKNNTSGKTGIISHNCQDLNRLQYTLLPFFKRKGGRYIFIYDKNQAIYGFSGADCNATQNIERIFAPIAKFELPINYRCGSKILLKVNSLYNIGIKPRPNANEGKVINIGYNEISDYIHPNDFVLGRTNKQLVEVALELIKNGKPIYLTDKEIVNSIIKFVKSLQEINTIEDLKKRADNFIRKYNKIENQSEKNKKQDIFEKYNIVKLLIKSYKNSKNISESIIVFINYIKEVINTENPKDCIRIMSIHKSKGLEANNVFCLSKAQPFYSLARSKDMMLQEKNLSYVAMTRAKENLYLVEDKGENDE